MASRTLLLCLSLLGVIYASAEETVSNSFLIVSTTESPSGSQLINDRLSKLEQHMEIHVMLQEMMDHYIRKGSQEIIEQIATKVDKKLDLLSAELNSLKTKTMNLESSIKKHLELTKIEIMKETEKQLSAMKKELISNVLDLELNTSKQITNALKNITRNNFDKNETCEVLEEDNKTPTDCQAVKCKRPNVSGVYDIQPKLAATKFPVWCDMRTQDGGWTYVLNRFDGSQSFFLNWTEYKNGFGNPSSEFWLGLEHLYEITNNTTTELLFELVDWNSNKYYARYDDFKIGNETEGYVIRSLGNHSGNAPESFSYHLGKRFSTLDKDPNCQQYKGGWWFDNCFFVHLTGRYVKRPEIVNSEYGLEWKFLKSPKEWYNLKEARMMVRSRSS